jgi:hypothetical protein
MAGLSYLAGAAGLLMDHMGDEHIATAQHHRAAEHPEHRGTSNTGMVASIISLGATFRGRVVPVAAHNRAPVGTAGFR